MNTITIFKYSRAIRRLYEGPLGRYIDVLTTQLQAQRYSQTSVAERLRVVADFTRWLARRHFDAVDVDADRVQRFLVHRRRTRSVGRSDRSALQKVVNLLSEKGVVHGASPGGPTSRREQAQDKFSRYLLQVRGLSPVTVRGYLPLSRNFVSL